MWSAQTLFQWIDLLWLPVAMLVVHPGQRLMAGGFALACALLMRLQVELMQEIGYPRGFLPILQSDLFNRGLITYGIFLLAFLLMSYYSKETDRFVYMAASITILTIAFCVSTAVMLL